MPKWWITVALVIQATAVTMTHATSTNNRMPRNFSAGLGLCMTWSASSPPAPKE